MPSRNFLLITGLVLFLVGYVGYWAYNTHYLEPRKILSEEIALLSYQIEEGQKYHAGMAQFCINNYGLYYRTLPQNQNAAQFQYSYWLLELLQYSGFQNPDVDPYRPVRMPFGASFQFTIQCTGTLEQLSYFLFEFYYAPFLHRITTMTLVPVEGEPDQMRFSITVNALTLNLNTFSSMINTMGWDWNSIQPVQPFPTGWTVPRLTYLPQSATQETFFAEQHRLYDGIGRRNLLQTAKGGIDKADYTILTGVVALGDQPEAWFRVLTDDVSHKKMLGDPIQFGSFSGRLVEILDRDIVLQRDNGTRWLLTTGENLNEAFALPPETGWWEE